MRRKIVRPYGQSISSMRALSLLMTLALVWMLYDWTRNPVTWSWLASAQENSPSEAAPAAVADKKTPPPPEVVVPGPNDLDPKAVELFQSRKELLSDRTGLREREMLPYWQLMGWSRTEPLQKLEKRAAKDVAFSQIWGDPDRYRGKPIRLRMHVRRILHYPAPKNPVGVKDVYEAWGWTDDSKSFPYVVVFPERPPGLPIGTDIRAEIVFVGYFLKVMTYTAFDNARGAPLLVGRVRLVGSQKNFKPVGTSSAVIFIFSAIGLIALAAFGIRHLMSFSRRHKNVTLAPGMVLPDELLDIDGGSGGGIGGLNLELEPALRRPNVAPGDPSEQPRAD